MTREFQDLERFRVPPGFRGRTGFVVLLWQLVQSTLFGLSPQPLYAWRRALLRLFGAKIGRKVLVRPTARVTYPWKVEIGDCSWIGDHAELYSLDRISIGRNAAISQRSYLCTASHDMESRWPCRGGRACQGMVRTTVASNAARPAGVTSSLAFTVR